MSETLDTGALAEELRALARDAEALLAAGGANGAEQREHLADTLSRLRERLAGLEDQAQARARELDGYVRDNPWAAIAVVAGAALVLGMLLARR